MIPTQGVVIDRKYLVVEADMIMKMDRKGFIVKHVKFPPPLPPVFLQMYP